MPTEIVRTACPHDCPSACGLEVERLSPTRIGAVRGMRDLPFTAGVVCEKVARYAERVHHPERLTQPLKRVGVKGEGRFEPIGWDEALDTVATAFRDAAARHGPETVWPYHSGGTLGIVQRWGLDRLRHVMGYSGELGSICVTPAVTGWKAGVGAVWGVDPCEIADSDLVLIWGANPVHTQVNLMSHIQRARKARSAKLVVIDVYRTATAKAADQAVILKPGTDAALAAAMMHVILKEGLADRDYLARLTDFDEQVERHLEARDPAWAAAITGLDEAEIFELARLYGRTGNSYLRLGLGCTRSRNGAVTAHAISCLPALTGAWAHRGGGAFLASLDNWGLDTTIAHGLDRLDPKVRVLDQSRIGAVLCGEPDALAGGPPVTAMIIQNANSADVAPDSAAVRRGLMRDDLFLCVHEQFMTATAAYADIVLPAATFLETDDLYMGWGHTTLNLGQRVLDRFAEARSNHEVVCGLAERLGATHRGFEMSEPDLVAATLEASGKGDPEAARDRGWVDCALEFDHAHFLDGFGTEDRRFHFKPDWAALGAYHHGMPGLPDHWDAIESADDRHPFRLVTPPSRTFLNTSFNETPGSLARERRPEAMIHPDDAAAIGISDGARLRLGNQRGAVELWARIFDGVQPGTIIAEGIWPDEAFPNCVGINHLVGGDPVPPAGGAAFHDTAVWAVGV